MDAVTPPAPQILSASLDDALLIALVGPMTFRAAPAFKSALLTALRAPVALVAVDMSRCSALDSTFMGTIASLAFAFRKAPTSRLVFLDLSSESAALLKGLGILPALDAFSADRRPPSLPSLEPLAALLQPIPLENPDSAFILEAHESLALADPENVARFRHVVECLRNESPKS